MNYVEAASAPLRKTGQIKLHGKEAFEGMRKAGRLVADCLDMLTEHVKPGVATEKIDQLVAEFARDHRALPATLMYRGYRKSTCTSINHVVCHGIPGDKVLKDGDTLNIDVTVIKDGWHGDTSRMYYVGKPEVRAQRRHDQNEKAGIVSDFESVLADVQRRDAADSSRATSPLRPADDATIVDTSDMSPEDVVQALINVVKESRS